LSDLGLHSIAALDEADATRCMRVVEEFAVRCYSSTVGLLDVAASEEGAEGLYGVRGVDVDRVFLPVIQNEQVIGPDSEVSPTRPPARRATNNRFQRERAGEVSDVITTCAPGEDCVDMAQTAGWRVEAPERHPATVPCGRLRREQLCRNPKVLRQLLRLTARDGPPSFYGVAGVCGIAEDVGDVGDVETACIEQTSQRLMRSGRFSRPGSVLVVLFVDLAFELLDQKHEQRQQLLLFGRDGLALVHQLLGDIEKPVVLLRRFDHAGLRPCE
jgi:hypothetical protein